MIFFKYKLDISDTELYAQAHNEATHPPASDGRRDAKAEEYRSRDIIEIAEKLNAAFQAEKACCAKPVDVHGKRAELTACYEMQKMTADELDAMILRRWDGVRIVSREEITHSDFRVLMLRADANGLYEPTLSKVENVFALDIWQNNFYDHPPYKIEENMSRKEYLTKEECLSLASDIMASDDFIEEIGRIYSDENKKEFLGHPVHYFISAGTFEAAKDIIDILVPALYSNGRLLSGRILHLSKMHGNVGRDNRFKAVFSSATGGCVVVRLPERADLTNVATDLTHMMEATGEMLEKVGNSTLFIFVDVSGQSIVTSEAIKTLLAHADMVQLTEGSGTYEDAVRYIDILAQKMGYDDYKIEDVTRFLPEKETYSVSDIFDAYNRWYAKGLKSHVYKAYREIDTYKIKTAKREVKPYETLMSMIGLDEVKHVVDEIIDSARVNNIRKLMGFADNETALHMLFSGNPGTAKTTVARLLSQILKEESVLSTGHMVECGRQDLVGRYVGWTAKIVAEKFQSARGGVLFIDEAYALVDDSNSFGAEAINTIVQQMENYRNEVIVIFAGYPDKMRDFLAQNEGLNSRIAFHLNFPDYSGAELMGILDLMAKKKGFSVTDGAREKCLALCDKACKIENFGNGRFVRNMLEQATMHQATRILKSYDGESITKKIASQLLEEDFAMPHITGEEKIERIGFHT